MSDYARLPKDDAIAVPDKTHPLASKLPKMKLGMAYMRWFSGLKAQVDIKPSRKASVTLQAQGASIGVTPLPIDTVTQGVWRISVTVRVTRPGTLTGTIQVSILWTERGVVQIESTANLTANLTTTREGKTFVIRSDGSSPISMSSTFTTTGATPMQYSVDVVAEELAADA